MDMQASMVAYPSIRKEGRSALKIKVKHPTTPYGSSTEVQYRHKSFTKDVRI